MSVSDVVSLDKALEDIEQPMNNKKIALITGATRGIGLAIAKAMSKHDYIVLGTGTSDNSSNLLKKSLKLIILKEKHIN